MIDANYALFDKYSPNQLNRSPSFQESLNKNEIRFKDMKERYFNASSYIDLTKLAEDPDYLSHFEPIPKMKTVENPYNSSQGEGNILNPESRSYTGKTSQKSNTNPTNQGSNSSLPLQVPGFNTNTQGNLTTQNNYNTQNNQNNMNPRPSNRSEYITSLMFLSLVTLSIVSSTSCQPKILPIASLISVPKSTLQDPRQQEMVKQTAKFCLTAH
jgi:hypothetical protein